MSNPSAYHRPEFHWKADSGAADTPSGLATFTYREFNTDRIVTKTLRFESFVMGHEVSRLLDVAHSAGYEKGIRDTKFAVEKALRGMP